MRYRPSKLTRISLVRDRDTVGEIIVGDWPAGNRGLERPAGAIALVDDALDLATDTAGSSPR